MNTTLKTRILSIFILLSLLIGALAPVYADSKNSENTDIIYNVEQLNSDKYTISVGTGSGAMIVAESKFPYANIIYANSATESFLNVQRGDADAYIHTAVAVNDVMNENVYPDLTILSDCVGTVDSAVALQKGSTELKSLMNDFIKTIKEDGTFDDMYRRWITEGNLEMPEIATPSNPASSYKFATSGEIKPYNYVGDNGDVTGFDVEFIKRFALYANADIEIEVMSFPSMVASLQSERIDAAVSNFNITQERLEVIDFSDPYISEQLALVVKKDRLESYVSASTQVKSVEDLKGRTMGAIVGAIQDQVILKKNPDQNIAYYDNLPDLIQALKLGKIDGFVHEEQTLVVIQKGNPGEFVVLNESYGESSIAYAMSKENTQLREEINEVINKFRDDGTLDLLISKWLYSDDDETPEIEYEEYDASRGVLNVAIDPSNTGMSYMASGEYVGYEVEVLYRIAKELGYKLEYTVVKFSGLIPSIVSGKCDIAVGSITPTEERAQSVAFTEATIVNDIYCIVRYEEEDVEEDSGFWGSIKSSFTRTFITESRWKLVVNGLLVTVLISICAIVFGTVLGFFYSFALRSEKKFIKKISNAISTIYTGMPLIVVLMILFYVIFAKSNVSAVVVSIIGLSIDFCISVAGMLNTGILGVSDGQRKAALALGYRNMDVFVKIVFPQAANQMFGQYQGAIVGLVKATAVVGYITVEDLTRVSDIIRSRTYEAFFPLIATALIYLILARVLVALLTLLGNKMDPQKRKVSSILKGIDPEFAEFNKQTVQLIYSRESTQKNDEVLISLRHLEKAYPDVTPLKDVNADIRRGDVIAIIGPSGTGKSTLLNCINKLDPATNGEIWIDGQNIMDPSCNIEVVRRNLGMVFQSFNLFEHKTVVENVMMAPMDVYKRDKKYMYGIAMGLLDLVGMADKALAYPSQLSGGQKQRVAIARTLAMGPEIILFDEPTSALDPSMVGEVQSVIKTLAKTGFTMLIVTHDMEFAREVSNRVFYMDQGIIYDDDTPENVFDNPSKPNTKAFIYRKKAFVRKIQGPYYDYIAAANDLVDFGKKNWWSRKQINDADTIFEEVCQQLIQSHFAEKMDTEFVVNYYEANQNTEICITYSGEKYNPLDSADEIVKALIENSFGNAEYSFAEGVNTLKFSK